MSEEDNRIKSVKKSFGIRCEVSLKFILSVLPMLPKSAPSGSPCPDAPPREESITAAKELSTPQNEEDTVRIIELNDPKDPLSPLNKSSLEKWVIIVVISLSSFSVTCCSSMVAYTYPQIKSEFHVGSEVAILGLSLFVFGLGLSPLFLGPLSELYGRRPIYVISYAFFVIFNIPVATARNIETWLIGRFLTGFSGSAFLSVSGGTVSDLFLPSQIGPPMSLYTASPFLGPVCGPIISGFINQHLSWRWTFYVVLIAGIINWFLVALLVPETYLPAILLSKAKSLRKQGEYVKAPSEKNERKSIVQDVLDACKTPFLLLAMEPMTAVLCLWTSILLGLTYMFFGAFTIVYESYEFETQYVGLTFIGIGIGIVIASASYPIWTWFAQKIANKSGAPAPPEECLRRGLVGAVICPISLFWFAFTTYRDVHWMVSIVATIPFGMGTIWSFQAVFTYLVSAFRPVAASAMAANSFARCCFAAAFPLFTPAMFKRLGTQWALALCGFLLVAIAPFPFLFFKYGDRLRKGSRFSS